MSDEITKQNTMQNLTIMEPESVSYDSENLYTCLTPFIMKEFRKANLSETKGAMLQKFWLKTGKFLGLSDADRGVMFNGKGNHVQIHTDVIEMVQALYDSIRETGIKCDNLRRHFTVFNSSCLQDPTEIRSLLREFVKIKEINKDPNNQNKKDKVLKDNALNVILAVDGMLGKEVSDLTNYIGNFGVGNAAGTKEEQHVVAVREMYKQIPEMITGTDSTYLITQILLSLYNKHNDENNDSHPIVKQHIAKCRDYLLKQGDYYKEINDITNPDFVEKLKNFYASAVDVKEVAREKLDQFIATLKKKNVNESKKYDQSKKRKDDEEEDVERRKQQKPKKLKSEK